MRSSVKHWQDLVNLILGVWMLVSPWILGFQSESGTAANAVILGVLIAAVALIASVRAMAWQEWTNLVLGVWLIISPWVLRFSHTTAAMWDAVIVGILVALLALWAAGTDKDIGGWWSTAA